MKPIWKILPLFVSQWLARKYCERFVISGVIYVGAFEDVLIRENPYAIRKETISKRFSVRAEPSIEYTIEPDDE